jgi:flagellar basal-body rod protein FlgF
MDPLTISAAAGMRSRLESLDLLSNNIANASTVGYKADRDAFLPWVSEQAREGFPDPVESPDLERHYTDHQQGPLTRTGQSLDFAIFGRGMFQVETPQGARFTRAGAFQVNGQGKLQTAAGHLVKVRPADGRGFRLNPALPVETTADGAIRQQGILQGTLEIFDFESLDAVNKEGSSYFRLDSDSLTPKLAMNFEVKQGYLEQANSGTAESAVRLVSVMRQFEALQKAATIGGEMNRRAIEEVAKVNP